MSVRTAHIINGCVVDTYWFEWGGPLHTRSTLVCIEHDLPAPFLTWNEVMDGEFQPLWKCAQGETLNEREVRGHRHYESRHKYRGEMS